MVGLAWVAHAPLSEVALAAGDDAGVGVVGCPVCFADGPVVDVEAAVASAAWVGASGLGVDVAPAVPAVVPVPLDDRLPDGRP